MNKLTQILLDLFLNFGLELQICKTDSWRRIIKFPSLIFRRRTNWISLFSCWLIDGEWRCDVLWPHVVQTIFFLMQWYAAFLRIREKKTCRELIALGKDLRGNRDMRKWMMKGYWRGISPTNPWRRAPRWRCTGTASCWPSSSPDRLPSASSSSFPPSPYHRREWASDDKCR